MTASIDQRGDRGETFYNFAGRAVQFSRLAEQGFYPYAADLEPSAGEG